MIRRSAIRKLSLHWIGQSAGSAEPMLRTGEVLKVGGSLSRYFFDALSV
jgi:hypothetical protein